MVEHHSGSLCQAGRGEGRNGVARMQAEEMVDVAVLVIWVIDVTAPFEKLPVTTYLVRGEAVEHGFPARSVFAVYSEHVGRRDEVDGAAVSVPSGFAQRKSSQKRAQPFIRG